MLARIFTKEFMRGYKRAMRRGKDVSVEVFLDAAVPHKSAEGRYNHCKTASPDYG